MRSARAQLELDVTVAFKPLQNPILGNGAPTVRGYRHFKPVLFIPADRRVDNAVVISQIAVENGAVQLFNSVRRKLLAQPRVRKVGLCDDYKPRRVLVRSSRPSP